jgi:hypothetical protein
MGVFDALASPVCRPLWLSASGGDSDIGRSHLLRQAARQIGVLIASLLAGFAVGVAYRFLFDPAAERDPANFLRSGLQGAGVALAVLTVQMGLRRARGPGWARRCDDGRSRANSSSEQS